MGIMDELYREIYSKIRKIEESEQQFRFMRKLGLAERLHHDDKDKEAYMIIQQIKNELMIDYPDFFNQDDKSLV
jgi:hypothetical protein